MEGNARILLKREDLVHGGAHKGNQVLGQALLAKRMGKQRIIAETGAGQHGTATAMVCALLGLDCTIYMGATDVVRQAPNVERMELMGATVVPVDSGAGTLKDAVNEALRDWTASFADTHYLLGPHARVVQARRDREGLLDLSLRGAHEVAARPVEDPHQPLVDGGRRGGRCPGPHRPAQPR